MCTQMKSPDDQEVVVTNEVVIDSKCMSGSQLLRGWLIDLHPVLAG